VSLERGLPRDARVSAKATISRTSRRALRHAAVALDAVLPRPAGVTVLSYHQVGAPQPGAVNLAVDAFDAQMGLLADQRQRTEPVTLDDAIAGLASGATPTTDQVVVTFDDGTADFVDHAVPVLVRHGIPATLYLATAFVEDQRSFWDDGTVLSWSALRDVLETGLVAIGSHTHTHALLDRVDAATAGRELEASRALVEDRLGVTPVHFAYPKAMPPARGSATDLVVRGSVGSAAVAGGRVNRFGATDLWRLSRTPIVAADDLDAFARKAGGGLRLEGEVRERVDRLRYRRAAR